MKKILFSDLDGTIIETKSGETFPKDINDWKLKKGFLGGLRGYQPDYLIIVTNQGGVEKGYWTTEQITEKLDCVCKAIAAKACSWGKFKIESLACCSNDRSNPYRKPNTGMLGLACNNFHFDMDNDSFLMIGDASGLPGNFSDSDLMTAKNFGIDYMDINEFVKKYEISNRTR